jgi:hypothetical protein
LLADAVAGSLSVNQHSRTDILTLVGRPTQVFRISRIFDCVQLPHNHMMDSNCHHAALRRRPGGKLRSQFAVL